MRPFAKSERADWAISSAKHHLPRRCNCSLYQSTPAMVFPSRIFPDIMSFTTSRQRDQFVLDPLVVFGLGLAGLEAAGQENGHGLFQEAGAGIEEQSALPSLRGVAGLLQQLALAGGQRISRRDRCVRPATRACSPVRHIGIGAPAARAVPGRIRPRQARRPTGMADHFANGRDAVGLLHPVARDIEDPSLEDSFRRQNLQRRRRRISWSCGLGFVGRCFCVLSWSPL